MKILDKYLLKTLLTTFATVFIILFFIFILQTIWLFIAELAGKDLDFGMIIKFLLFSMPRIVPLVLPLSILLASIMTFGNFAENYEFAAMKSAGMSLQRTLRGLTVFIFVLSILAFIFANNVIPYAEFKFINFRKNIAQVKPAMAITEGQFSDVGIYNIKVNKKSGNNGNILSDITIHKKSSLGEGNKIVIKANDGELVSNEKSSILKLILNNGNYYEDIVPKNYEDRERFPFAKSAFKKYIINIDLSELNKVDVDKEDLSNSNTMLSVNELSYTLDSLHKNMKTEVVSFSENMNMQTSTNKTVNDYGNNPTPPKKLKKIPKNLLSLYNEKDRSNILKTVSSNLENLGYTIESSKVNLENKQKNINEHQLAFYDKFVIAFACFLMFFIGAPLGAIIKKGGLGLPIVFAVFIFISFHFINTFGKRISQEDGLSPFWGAWMSSFILGPLAIYLTYKATNDIESVNIDAVFLPIKKMFKKLFPKKLNTQDDSN